MERVWLELRHALRALARARTYGVLVVVTLGLGAAAIVAVSAVLHAVILRPLPFKEPAQLVRIAETNVRKGEMRASVSAGSFLEWRERSRSFQSLAAWENRVEMQDWLLTSGGEPEYVRGTTVSPSFFATLRVQPALGRTFPENVRAAEVVISDGLWRRRFGADPAIIGKAITFQRWSHQTVVGVMPRDFNLPEKTDVWGADVLQAPVRPSQRVFRYREVVGRLKPGVSREQAQAELATIARQLERDHPDTNAGWSVAVLPLHESLVGHIKERLLLVFAAVVCFFFVACANVANLVVARTAARSHELAVTLALGASRGRVLAHVLTENLLLGAAAGLLGLLLTYWLIHLARQAGPLGIPRLQEVTWDGRAAVLAVFLPLAAALVASLLAAARLAGGDVSGVLRGTVPAGEDRFRGRLRQWLVAAELAVAIVTLVLAGLLARTMLKLQSVDLGFQPQQVVVAEVRLPVRKFPEPPWAHLASFYRELHARVASLPNVQSVGATSDLPLAGRTTSRFVSRADDGLAHNAPVATVGPGERWSSAFHVVTPSYFRTMHVPLVAGRYFDERDVLLEEHLKAYRAPPGTVVAVVNETLARLLFQGEDAIGRMVRMTPRSFGETLRIVGVVKDVRYSSVDQNSKPEIYVAHGQAPSFELSFAVRTDADVERMSATLRRAMQSFDADLMVLQVRPLADVTGDAISPTKATSLVLGMLAGLALVLAAIGVYGVIGYLVAQRTSEIGIRIALGAQRRDVMKLILGYGLRLASIGVICGLVLSTFLTRAMQGLLYEVTPMDPLTLVAASGLLLAVAIIACYVPARRAMRIDPVETLRRVT